MVTTIMNGNALAKKIKDEVRMKVNELYVPPTLAVILVGNDPASEVYVRNKRKDCEECGIISETYRLLEDATERDLFAIIHDLNFNSKITGILVQMPLPKHLNPDKIIAMINPDKDVDCFNPFNVGRLAAGSPEFLPCTPAGVIRMLQEHEIEIAGEHCVVLGRSNIVGKPMSALLLQHDGTVTTCHSKTKDLASITREADILISAIGKKKFVTADMVKEGAVVIDVGINRDENGKLCGDVDFERVSEKASYISPVPGGVGPMTRAMLMENVLVAANKLDPIGRKVYNDLR